MDVPKEPRAPVLFRVLQQSGWALNRISGSHHVFTKAGERSIPVSVHNHCVTRNMCRLVLRQARIYDIDAEEAPAAPAGRSGAAAAAGEGGGEAMSGDGRGSGRPPVKNEDDARLKR